MYIESSAPRMAGDQAVLESQLFKSGTIYCLSFWYHMYGSGIGQSTESNVINLNTSIPVSVISADSVSENMATN